MGTSQIENYKDIAKQSRLKCLELVWKAQTSHIGSLFSCADILAVLFEKIDLNKDRFVLSAGWKACMLYFHLWRKEKITTEELNSFCQPGSKFIGLAEPIIPEISAAGGSLGIGFSMAVGMARARKSLGKEGKIYVLMSDGEMHCGNVWESIMKAGHECLNNLIVIIDYNKFCAMGKTNEVLNIEPLAKKWEDFGWYVYEINGHDFCDIEQALICADSNTKKPSVIIAHTIKGKGWKRAEGNNLYHYKQLDYNEYNEAKEELEKLYSEKPM